MDSVIPLSSGESNICSIMVNLAVSYCSISSIHRGQIFEAKKVPEMPPMEQQFTNLSLSTKANGQLSATRATQNMGKSCGKELLVGHGSLCHRSQAGEAASSAKPAPSGLYCTLSELNHLDRKEKKGKMPQC